MKSAFRHPVRPFLAVVLLGSALAPACRDGSDPTGIDNGLPEPNQPPTASFTVSATEGHAPLEVLFDAGASRDPDGEIVSYDWEFGDGHRGTGVRVTHVYRTPGYFVPRLTVTDDRGATDTALDPSILVTISPGEGAGTIAGTVWHDRAGDGVRLPDSPGVVGSIVFLDLEGTGSRDPGDPFTVTDHHGRYAFPGIDTHRSYLVTQELGLGWTNTFAARTDGSGGEPSPGPSRIIGGTPAERGEFPFQVALLFAAIPANENAFTCGGTFIASRWVLTAAHCVVDIQTGGLRSPSTFQVLVGTHDLTSGGERIPVKTIRVFPNFDADSFAGQDIALLELDREFMIPRTVLQTPERPAFSRPGTVATAIGWGRTTWRGSISTTLRQVEMEIISNDECRRMLDEDVVASTICAGLLGTTRSICSGDSGGPLMVPANGEWVQVGVSSFARNCQPPVAFARVSEFTAWIQRQVPREPSMAVEVGWGEGDSAQVDFGNFR